ncbi:MAG: hypothetical protein WBF42_19455, partial [Terracidiphilus sp.]
KNDRRFSMMKRLCKNVSLLFCLVALGQSGLAQGNPWNGSWKMDASSLKYAGPTFSVKTDAGGYTVTREGAAGPRTVCDGKPHTTPNGAETCTKTATGYMASVSENGKVILKADVSVSTDGKTRTVKAERFPSDDKPFTITTTSKRVSGGPGMDGVWREVKFVESRETGVLTIKVTGDSVAFKETDNDKPVLCKLDGTPTKVEEDGTTMSVKRVDSHTLTVTYAGKDGKARRHNTFVLSPDGKSITETDMTPAPSPSKMTVMFHKS